MIYITFLKDQLNYYCSLKFNLGVMKKNMGSIDRIVRVLLAIIISILFFTNVVSGTLGVVLLVIGGVFIATSFINSCPLYSILGINSCPVKK